MCIKQLTHEDHYSTIKGQQAFGKYIFYISKK